MTKRHMLELSADLIARCKAFAAEVVVHYTRGEDREANMPWTREDMTPVQLQQWIASREEAGRLIDIETCELGRWAAYDCDPYGVKPNLPEQMRQIGTNRFVRSPESRGWVGKAFCRRPPWRPCTTPSTANGRNTCVRIPMILPMCVREVGGSALAAYLDLYPTGGRRQ